MKNLKIGIYDKWLRELGGGEKVALVMAETLSKKGYDVELISYSEVDKEYIEKKMNVDLSKTRIVTWLEWKPEILTPRTKKYDIFINVSYLDHLPSKAKKSIYYILFPTPVRRTILGFVKYETILPFLRKFLIIPQVITGFRPVEEVMVRSGKWLDLTNKIIIANPPKKFKAIFRIYPEIFKVSLLDAVEFSSPNCEIKLIDKYVDHHHSILTYSLEIHIQKSESAIINLSVDKLAIENRPALVSFTIRNFRYFLFNLIKRFLPAYEMALYGSSTYKPASGIDTYSQFLADSAFTKKWTRRYWGKEAKVLYPPVDIEEFKPGRKKNMIINVGRFFIGGHSKRQDILVKVFKDLIDKKMLDGEWELHLVGGVAPGDVHESYVEDLRKEAFGYPIYFHFSSNFNQLKKLYSEAKIYWHATGYGEDESRNPIRFEHFGIAIVEAAASGCIPVVFRGGGVTEIITNSEDGFLWRTLNQLRDVTSKLSKDKKLFAKISKNAQKRARFFSKKCFSEEFLKIVESLI